jgi:hypothetical protein
MNHRAAHRRRKERVVIRLKAGTFEYDYTEPTDNQTIEGA